MFPISNCSQLTDILLENFTNSLQMSDQLLSPAMDLSEFIDRTSTAPEEITRLKCRLAKNYKIDQVSGCWLWQKGISNKYGMTKWKKKDWRAHRLMKLLASNLKLQTKNAEGVVLVLRHKCTNKHCCNPDHLELGTEEENMADRIRDGTDLAGANHPKSSIDEKTAEAIMRSNYKNGTETKVQRGKRFGCSEHVISQIDCGKTWIRLRERLQIPLVERIIRNPTVFNRSETHQVTSESSQSKISRELATNIIESRLHKWNPNYKTVVQRAEHFKVKLNVINRLDNCVVWTSLPRPPIVEFSRPTDWNQEDSDKIMKRIRERCDESLAVNEFVGTTCFMLKDKWKDKQISLSDRTLYPHVFAAEENLKCFKPDNLFALHKCGEHDCCRPDHLYFGTINDNNQDKYVHGTMSSKMNITKAEEIRAEFRKSDLYALPFGQKFAHMFEVSASTIVKIVKNKAWLPEVLSEKCRERCCQLGIVDTQTHSVNHVQETSSVKKRKLINPNDLQSVLANKKLKT